MNSFFPTVKKFKLKGKEWYLDNHADRTRFYNVYRGFSISLVKDP